VNSFNLDSISVSFKAKTNTEDPGSAAKVLDWSKKR
jgi:hypothetical protein